LPSYFEREVSSRGTKLLQGTLLTALFRFSICSRHEPAEDDIQTREPTGGADRQPHGSRCPPAFRTAPLAAVFGRTSPGILPCSCQPPATAKLTQRRESGFRRHAFLCVRP